MQDVRTRIEGRILGFYALMAALALGIFTFTRLALTAYAVTVNQQPFSELWGALVLGTARDIPIALTL